MKTVILINVGTPESPAPEDVGRYLKEFLMDKNIITIPRPFRDILVKALIVPRRKFSSAQKYQSIWTEQGSPLLVQSRLLQQRMQQVLGGDWKVLLGMQVGKPSLKTAITEALQNSEDIVFVPLYPQFAKATTGGATELIKKMVPAGRRYRIINAFYDKDWFQKSLLESIQNHIHEKDHLLLSYHGLPISQVKSFRKECDLNSKCCDVITACQEGCYKAQCLQTTKLLKANLHKISVSTGFQSRLGRGKWIEPSTEHVMRELVQNGVRHLAVACPSFVSDCLETLEEIGIELRESFLKAGGKSFQLIPCVNNSESFVQGLSAEIRSANH